MVGSRTDEGIVGKLVSFVSALARIMAKRWQTFHPAETYQDPTISGGKMGTQSLADSGRCADELFLESSSRCLTVVGLRSNILPLRTVSSS